MTYKTTQADIRYYRKRVQHWMKRLSLGDWKVEVYLDDTGEDSARVEMWHNAHGAHIRLNEKLASKPHPYFLDSLALHEVSHILLCDLKRLINDRVCTDAMAETAEHAVIRRLENALCGGD